jgi:hypothetical protein
MLWSSYKAAVPNLTSSLIEVGPDLKGQLSEISKRSWRLPLLVATGFFLLMVLALCAIMTASHFRR